MLMVKLKETMLKYQSAVQNPTFSLNLFLIFIFGEGEGRFTKSLFEIMRTFKFGPVNRLNKI